ncbi:hypothetical protein L4D09_28220 [Photobacterium makurazakiensis]|jgi:hypothetical protein
MIKALNKLTGLGMPKTCRIDEETHKAGQICLSPELRYKAFINCGSLTFLIDEGRIVKNVLCRAAEKDIIRLILNYTFTKER